MLEPRAWSPGIDLAKPATHALDLEPHLGQEIRKFARIRQALDKIPPEALLGGLAMLGYGVKARRRAA